MSATEDDSSWILELEAAVSGGCDFATVHRITKGRPVPNVLRPKVWQLALGVTTIKDSMSCWDELYDMSDQQLLRSHCHHFVDTLGNDEDDKVAIMSDIESVITCYCKSKHLVYSDYMYKPSAVPPPPSTSHHSDSDGEDKTGNDDTQTDGKENDAGDRESSGAHVDPVGHPWLDILKPLVSLKLTRQELYNCFTMISMLYIPRRCMEPSGEPFHLFRLLLLYHEPELCSFLDSKKISAEWYAHTWLRTLFASQCDLGTILNMWDMYIQQSDPFLVFYLALVLLVNAKDMIMELEREEDKRVVVDHVSRFPCNLNPDDVEDFCGLAQYYASRTPQSFRRDYQGPLFSVVPAINGDSSATGGSGDIEVSQALCLPVSVDELLQSNRIPTESVRYFLVDCRPAGQYNSGHLPTAFHLDANLMLSDPGEFSEAVDNLFRAQQLAIEAGSEASGEHLCFLGSGREEEDQYVHMVVANFLQHKRCHYISVARGGYLALHQLLEGNLSEGLRDHDPRACIVCVQQGRGNNTAPEHSNTNNTAGQTGAAAYDDFLKSTSTALKDRFSELTTAVKAKLPEVKEQLHQYIVNPHQSAQGNPHRHVSSVDAAGRSRRRYQGGSSKTTTYRGLPSVFSIGELEDAIGDNGDAANSELEVVNIQTWLKKSDVLASYRAHEIREVIIYPSYILLTTSHLFILRDLPEQSGMAYIMSRHPLTSIVKITSKKRDPNIITFKYGRSNSEDNTLEIEHQERFNIPQAAEATRAIKYQIQQTLDLLESPT